MFVLRITFVFVAASMFAGSAEAQLFRFRSNPNYNTQQYYSQGRYGYQSGYDARNYQYTQVQPRANYVPSQRYGVEPQTPACGCAQTQNHASLVPATTRSSLPQQQPQQSQQQLVQQQNVVVTYRDPNTGRLFQRRFLVRQPMAQNAIAQQPARRPDSNTAPTAVPPSPNSVLSVANPIAVTAPKLDPPSNDGPVATTSFDSPVLEKAPSDEFSVLNVAGDQAAKDETTSVLETALPSLESPSVSSESPGSLLDTGDSLDLDLPPLSLDDAN